TAVARSARRAGGAERARHRTRSAEAAEACQADPEESRRLMAKMDDREIIGIVRAEEDDAISYYTSEIVAEQEKALSYYYADPFGDEVEGRSSVVSHDVAETIDWLIPDIMRVFVSGDEVVKYEPRTQNDEPFAKQATEYANYVFFTD